MIIDYDKIREDNISEYGNGTRHLSFLSRLYTDRTHFIFELIQNAEDAGATDIHFNLFDDRLEITHNGRLFNELDVKGICGVDDGTKAEDLTKIGKFGVGFKSVYAFTNTPEVYSGDVSFKIENYVRPFSIPSKLENNYSKTLFILPLGTEKISEELARKEISKCISNLGARTLLFLKRIQEIEYTLPDLSSGVYLREEKQRGSARQVCVIGEKDGVEEVENWLIFERPIQVEESSQVVRVELGFRFDAKDKNQQNDESIERVKESPLFVFFPTEKETKLGFLIQGPYTTTPGRDNIIEDDWNKTLVNETALLITETLPKIKELGLFTASFLETLPIDPNDFPENSMFYPIFESVRDTLQKEALLPAEDGSFITADNALLAEADWLIDLLKDNQLKLLYLNGKKWIHQKVGKGALKEYFKKVLGIETIDTDGFASKVDNQFFKEQSDQWLMKFYSQLSKNKALWEKNTYYWQASAKTLRNKEFIRIQDNSHVKPFDNDDKPQVYLPTSIPHNYHPNTVKIEIAKDEPARRFLSEDLKLSEFNKVHGVIECILPKYRKQIESLPDKEEHLRDVDIIIDAMETDSQKDYDLLKKELKEASFIRSKLSDYNKRYYKPSDLYFSNESLDQYFEGDPDVQFVSPIYDKAASDLFFKIGVVKKVRIKKRIPNNLGHIEICDRHSFHKRGKNGFDPDIIVYGLENALSNVTLEKSRFIWNEIVIPNKECIKGIVENSTREAFTSIDKEENITSSFGNLLMKSKWLPGPNGFCTPFELSINDLPEEFERNDKVAELLGMKKDLINKLAAEVGVPAEDIELLKNYPKEFNEFKSSLKSEINESKTNNLPAFPVRPVTNPERRLEHQYEKQSNAPNRQYEKRERNVRTTNDLIEPKTWLRNQYTNDHDQMVCQICKKEMPFKTRDGSYYFEKKEIFSSRFLPKEQEAQYLALCPLCAAKYKEFIISDDDVMMEIKGKIINADGCEIPILFGEEEASIRFVETHFHDLKLILQNIKE
ncbi:MAG: hypothetical protein BWY08_00012 [Bacteroidetes bacterium ADurb.Bin174]|nr:MAG: hypothetical protein BWY08_00012 [Bacteroidetes bacterium ADurb.Bin174]HOD79232.1 hypothetical protein [Syntrophorhabdus sp.]